MMIPALAALLILPTSALASPDVRVSVSINGGYDSRSCSTWCDHRTCGYDRYGHETWVEFHPDRSSYVALYAAFSDGSTALVFPTSDWSNHWVERHDSYSVPVWVPTGVRLESVQAVASRHWFDPSECHVTYAPRHGGDWHEPRVTVVTAVRRPLVTWSFAVNWGSSHRYDVVRSWCWEPRRVERVTWTAPRVAPPIRTDRKYKSRDGRTARVREAPTVRKVQRSAPRATRVDVAHTGRDEAPRTVRWTSGERSSPDKKVKAKASSGAKASKSRGRK